MEGGTFQSKKMAKSTHEYVFVWQHQTEPKTIESVFWGRWFEDRRTAWRRVVDMNDRALRDITTGLGLKRHKSVYAVCHHRRYKLIAA